ncbi:MAG: prepilin peptidase [Anaerolineae bacterium]
MLNLLWVLVGFAVGVTVNVLADHLPERQRPQRPYCLQCGHVHTGVGVLGLGRRFLQGGKCPNCGAKTRWRTWVLELSTAVLFAFLPSLITDPINLAINSFYMAVLMLIIVIDLENKLILNVVTFPATALALLGSFLVTPDENNWKLALAGAVVGFVVFFAFYWIGQLLFGPGALGFGDVKLALLLGAMLGFHRIFFALVIGVALGGVGSLLALIISRRVGRFTYLPYGQYLAVAGMIVLIWGGQMYRGYVG